MPPTSFRRTQMSFFEGLLLRLLFLSSLLNLSVAAPAVVTIVDFTSWSFRGEIGAFANPLDADYAYASNLMTPPDDPRMCEFPPSLLDKNNKTISVELRTPVGLLISLGGGCNPIDKVNIALQIQREVTKAVRYLVFYNNDPDDPDDIPGLRESDFYRTEEDYQSLAVVAVSTTVGSAMLGRIEQLKDVTGANPQFLAKGNERWQMPMVLELITDRHTNRGGYSPPAPESFYWFRFVLFTLLIISPCCRAGYLWWAGGGRIRLRRNENGRIVGLQYIPPMTYWFASGSGPEGGPSITDRLTEEEVLALPEIVYRAPKEEDDTGADDKIVAESDGTTVESQAADWSEDEVEIAVGAGSDDAGEEPEPVSGPAEEDPSKSVTQKRNEENATDSPEQFTTTCTTCSICIDEFEEGERVRLLPRCNHAFHTDCIMPWLTERQGCCPLCKVSVIEQPEEENNEDDAESPREPGDTQLSDAEPNSSETMNSSEADDNEGVAEEEIEVLECVETELGRDGAVITEAVVTEETEPSLLSVSGEEVSSETRATEDAETRKAEVGETEDPKGPEREFEVDVKSKSEPEVVSADAAVTAEVENDGHEEKKVDPGDPGSLELVSPAKEKHACPFDEHPHDESDPDVPFDERPRVGEASETVWLQAVEDPQYAEEESSQSMAS